MEELTHVRPEQPYGPTPRLEVKNLHKRFPGVYAVKGVSFQVFPGEVHSLVGENGAGKSTLMKMINGELDPDEGQILYDGTVSNAKCVSDAQAIGISMIHQELATLPNMTVAENLFLGKEIRFGKTPFVNDRAMNEQCRQALEKYNFHIDPKTPVSRLSVAQAQMLEIIKAVRTNAGLIIMDEPTSSLSDEESAHLFQMIRELTAKQVAVIYISHRLEEVLDLSTKITVLRDGECIGTTDASQVDRDKLVELMVGRTLDNIYPKETVPMGQTVMQVEGLTRKGVFEEISFSVKAGEILGISGLVGAGRSEIMRGIFGIDKLDSGTIRLHDQAVSIQSPTDAIRNRIGLVTEDRKELGLVLCRSIRENITLPSLPAYFKGLLMGRRKEDSFVEEYRQSLSIKCHTPEVEVGTLSGGNQQKVVLAKWLLSKPKVLILDEPTRGIDVGAKFEIYKLMTQLAREGMAIIMISSELPEIIGMSDRVLVVSQGRITAEYMRDDIVSGKVTQKELLNSAL